MSDEEDIPPPPTAGGTDEMVPPPPQSRSRSSAVNIDVPQRTSLSVPPPPPDDSTTSSPTAPSPAPDDDDEEEEDFADERLDDNEDEPVSPQSQLHMRRVSQQAAADDEEMFSSSDDEEFKQLSVSASSSATLNVPAKDDNFVPKKKRSMAKRYSVLNESKTFTITKSHRFGRSKTREMVVDVLNRTLRFLNPQGKLRSEFPFTEMLDVKREVTSGRGTWDARRVHIVFRGNRTYEVKFSTMSAVEDFLMMTKVILAQNVFFSARQQNRALTASEISVSSKMSMDSLAAAAPDDEPHSPGAPMDKDDSAAPVITDTGYMDYHVKKKNKYGIKQDRILVLSSRKRVLMLLNERRKFKKEFDVNNILQVEIPQSKTGKSRAYIIFAASTEQKPFNLYFTDIFDRIHFCERLKTLGKHITIKENWEDSVNPHTLRFSVMKVNKMGVKKKRILYLNCKDQTVRSVNIKSNVKDTKIGGRLLRLEPSYIDRKALVVVFKDRANWNFIFSDTAARERFVVRVRAIMDGLYDKTPFTWTDPFRSGYNEDSLLGGTADDSKNATPSTAASSSSSSSSSSTAPPHNLRLFVGTWNAGGIADFSKDTINEFVPSNECDIYAIALQECQGREQFVKKLKCHIMNNWDKDYKEKDHTYTMLLHKNLWEIVMVVFVRRELLHRISNVETTTVACGVADVIGNKGAVALAFQYQSTPMCFVCCHLQARAERLSQRRENFQRIVRQIHFGTQDVDILHQFRHVFWWGDLNYRVDLEWDEVLELVAKRKWETMQAKDQLLNEVQDGGAFESFKEAPLNFPPTYRYERDSSEFSNKRNQPPSWTDRVLWRSLPGHDDALEVVEYGGAHHVLGSDHRPVYAIFNVSVPLPYELGVDHTSSKFPPLEIVLTNLVLRYDQPLAANATAPRLMLTLRSDIIETERDTHDVGAKSTKDVLEYHWNSETWLTPFVFNRHFLRTCHVTILVFGTNNSNINTDTPTTLVGACALSLRDALSKQSFPFRARVSIDGLSFATLSGEYFTRTVPVGDIPVSATDQQN